MEKTPSGWEKGEGEEGDGGEEEDRDVVREELEDTLKAIEHQKRMQRNMSSPPGISCDEDSDRPHTPSDMESVRLKSKLHASHSMDTITKVHPYTRILYV